MKNIPEEWTGDVVKSLHLMGKTRNELAKHLGVTRNYVSEILCGRRSSKTAKEKIISAIHEMEEEFYENECKINE